MKRIFFAIIAIFTVFLSSAQITKPVTWSYKTDKTAANEFTLIFTAKIQKDWHVYSQYTPDDGPLPLEIKYSNQDKDYVLIGKTIESPYKKKYNDVFEVDEYYFENNFTLTQKIKVLNNNGFTFKVELDYQVCKEACINDYHSFTISIPATEVKNTSTVSNDNGILNSNNQEINNDLLEINIKADSVKSKEKEEVANDKLNSEKQFEDETPEDKNGIISIFILAFLGGIVATFTPCVFPMIPMTVSFFLKQSGNKAKGRFNAIFYGICIVLICLAFTIPFHILEGMNRDVFSEISTNIYLNLFFFIIFTVFAISFFGAFEITMPSKLSNKVDNASNKGGLLGIFFMALTLIIVSFSCIGPALGFVFGTSLNSDGGALILTIAMFGFGLGLALPFMFFALVPNLMGNLPKSGGWLNTVKVVFGFIELALAFKFLSNADIGLELHWLERETFIALWVAIFAALALYLFGKIRLPHDSPLEHISVGRMLLGLLSLSFTIYLVPGLWGAPLKLISAFPPPKTYSESPRGFYNQGSSTTETLPEGASYTVHDIVHFEDYKEGVAYAKKVNKPILIDFTGKQCVNCRLMENNVWSDEKVLNILRKDVVLISLYGDDKKELPESEWYISEENGKQIDTVGEKWSEFQIQRFKNNARPLYVLLDLNEKELNTPVPYTPNIEEYYNWLKDGISKF